MRDGAGNPGTMLGEEPEPAPPPGIGDRLVRALEVERAHWFLWTPVVFGLGIGLYFSLSFEPSAVTTLAALAIAVALLAGRPLGCPVVILVALVTATSGFAAAKLRTELVRAPVLERSLHSVEVRGFVDTVEAHAKGGLRMTLRVASISGLKPENLPKRVRIRTLGEARAPSPGDGVRLIASLAPPAIPAIPGGFDFARTAWFSGIGGVGYARRAPERDETLGEPPRSLALTAGIEHVRQAISRRVRAVLPDETGAIATALITGERGGISEETNEAYRNSGLFHILSISGLHMVVMAGAVFYLTRLGLACVPRLALNYPIKKWAAVIACVAAFGYLLISGAAFATVRSCIMITIAFVSVLLDRPAIAMRNVAIAALIILTLYPESLLDVGFQMSFAAVAALVAAHEAMQRRSDARDATPSPRWLKPLWFFAGIIASTLVAGAAVAPFAAYHFHTSQMFAVLANVMAIPICNFVVMPAALSTLVLMPLGLEGPAVWLMGQGIDAMTWCAHYAADLPGAVVRIKAVPLEAHLVMVVGGLWLCLWTTRWRLLGVAGLAAGAALAATPTLPDVIAGRDGTLLAVRGADGRLVAAGGRKEDFELKRWLEHDGDGRSPAEVSSAPGAHCDWAGCVVSVKGSLVALARHPAALEDDCRRARILVLEYPTPRGCTGPELVLDFFRLRNDGTHALYIGEDGTIRVETVAAARGVRPWVGSARLGRRQSRESPTAERRASARRAPGAEETIPGERTRADTPRSDDPRPEVEEEMEVEAWPQ